MKKEEIIASKKKEEAAKAAEEKVVEDKTANETKPLEETKPAEQSDFSDEFVAPLPKAEEKKEEEVKEEAPKVNLYKEGAEVAPEVAPATGKKPAKAPAVTYSYSDSNLKGIETERAAFNKIYKKENTIKWIVTAVVLVCIICGYVIPLSIESLKANNVYIYITIGVLAVSVIGLGVYSVFSKKKLDKAMNGYFNKYYTFSNNYIFNSLGVSDVKGTVADKISIEDFSKNGLYSNVYKVGSRDKLTFAYHDMNMSLVDCAAQVKGKKALETVFVGKMLTAPNAYNGDGIVVYLKGNKRALPPTNLAGYEVSEDNHDYVIYTRKSGKKGLTQKVRAAIASIRTDTTLVDLAISIQPGTTYFLMGYEDTLMVLPLEKPFNPAPTEKFHEDLGKCFEVADALNIKMN